MSGPDDVEPPGWIAEAIIENAQRPLDLRLGEQFSPADWWHVDFSTGLCGKLVADDELESYLSAGWIIVRECSTGGGG